MNMIDGSAPPSPARNTESKVGRLVIVAIVAFLLGLLVADGAPKTNSVDPALAPIREEIAALKIAVEGLKLANEALRLSSDETGALSLDDTGYAPVRTNVGVLLFAAENAEPYLGGVRLRMKVGNPHFVTLSGFETTFTWGSESKVHKFTETLLPGTWTTVQVVLSPADPGTLKYVTVKASVSTLRLRG